MDELKYIEKIAVVKILKEMLYADNIVHEKEVEYMNNVLQTLGLDDTCKTEVDNLMTLQALSTIRGLSYEQKCDIAKMMGKMIVIDKDINYNEVKLYNAFCESCDIEKDFHLEDYPEYSLSGPFVNPEDLMNSI
jgi:uncharacterized tellurite resistance protein B-like protein